jgi:hypothetical protein
MRRPDFDTSFGVPVEATIAQRIATVAAMRDLKRVASQRVV